MKKIVPWLLICCLLLSMAGCAGPAHALAVPEYTKEGAWDQRDLQAELAPFLTQALPALLEGQADVNILCSPLNIYMALAMLAQVTAGETRAQVLDALGSPGLEELGLQASQLWRASYRNAKDSKRILGSSIWLDQGLEVDRQTLDALAADYFASVYQGEMGSDSLNDAYRRWMNDQTGGLLQQQVDGLKLEEDLRCAMATTVYYKAAWQERFPQGRTREEPFYGPDGEQTVSMMHRTDFGDYYWGDRFSAVQKKLDSGAMWFLLPDEGFTPQDLLADAQAVDFLINYRSLPQENHRRVKIHLAVPKYDVEHQIDLRPALKQLGITLALDPHQADFSALLPMAANPQTPEDRAYLGRAIHGVRVMVDEEGTEAAAYTQMTVAPSSAPLPDDVEEIWFTLDRPFLFVITGAEDLPLFVGMVNQP